MKEKVHVGIDPGRYGCIAIIRKEADAIFIDYSVTHLSDLRDLMFDYEIVLAVIERPFSMPHQSTKSAMVQGQLYGELLGALKMARLPFLDIRPQEWQKGYGCPTDRKARKLNLIEIADNLGKNADIRAFGKFKGASGERFERTSGRADAYLIGLYGISRGL